MDGNGLRSTGTAGALLEVYPVQFMEPIAWTYGQSTTVNVSTSTAVTVASTSVAAPVAGTTLVVAGADVNVGSLSSTNTLISVYSSIGTSSAA